MDAFGLLLSFLADGLDSRSSNNILKEGVMVSSNWPCRTAQMNRPRKPVATSRLTIINKKTIFILLHFCC